MVLINQSALVILDFDNYQEIVESILICRPTWKLFSLVIYLSIVDKILLTLHQWFDKT